MEIICTSVYPCWSVMLTLCFHVQNEPNLCCSVAANCNNNKTGKWFYCILINSYFIYTCTGVIAWSLCYCFFNIRQFLLPIVLPLLPVLSIRCASADDQFTIGMLVLGQFAVTSFTHQMCHFSVYVECVDNFAFNNYANCEQKLLWLHYGWPWILILFK